LKKKRKVILEKKTKKKEKKGKIGKKWKSEKKKCTIDYYCNPQCIGCGRTMISPHPLVLC
jgi:hypothetical protein